MFLGRYGQKVAPAFPVSLLNDRIGGDVWRSIPRTVTPGNGSMVPPVARSAVLGRSLGRPGPQFHVKQAGAVSGSYAPHGTLSVHPLDRRSIGQRW